MTPEASSLPDTDRRRVQPMPPCRQRRRFDDLRSAARPPRRVAAGTRMDERKNFRYRTDFARSVNYFQLLIEGGMIPADSGPREARTGVRARPEAGRDASQGVGRLYILQALETRIPVNSLV